MEAVHRVLEVERNPNETLELFLIRFNALWQEACNSRTTSLSDHVGVWRLICGIRHPELARMLTELLHGHPDTTVSDALKLAHSQVVVFKGCARAAKKEQYDPLMTDPSIAVYSTQLQIPTMIAVRNKDT